MLFHGIEDFGVVGIGDVVEPLAETHPAAARRGIDQQDAYIARRPPRQQASSSAYTPSRSPLIGMTIEGTILILTAYRLER